MNVENEKYTGKINYVKLLNYNIKGVYKSYEVHGEVKYLNIKSHQSYD